MVRNSIFLFLCAFSVVGSGSGGVDSASSAAALMSQCLNVHVVFRCVSLFFVVFQTIDIFLLPISFYFFSFLLFFLFLPTHELHHMSLEHR